MQDEINIEFRKEYADKVGIMKRNNMNDTPMTTDTPRTDAFNWTDDDDSIVECYQFACQLERELNEATKQIKLLEEAGNDLAKESEAFASCGRQDPHLIHKVKVQISIWNRVKDYLKNL